MLAKVYMMDWIRGETMMAMSEVLEQMEKLIRNEGVSEDNRGLEAIEQAVTVLRADAITNDYKSILRKLIKEADITQQELADKLGITRQALNQVLTRNEYGVRYETFLRIIEALGYELVLRKKL